MPNVTAGYKMFSDLIVFFLENNVDPPIRVLGPILLKNGLTFYDNKVSFLDLKLCL